MLDPLAGPLVSHPKPTLVRRALQLALVATLALLPSTLGAEAARFDLTGPRVEVRVTRAGVTLPIASVPNLQHGDRLWLHPDLPATQSIHYLMVVVFLRGTTNPPPDNWFIRIEAWDKKVREEGVEVPVPDEAEQAVLLLAPVTGGDFSTLRSAVQGRPGIFVRAAQDLNLAGFEQARIEKYIASMKQVPTAEVSDAKALQEHSTLIAGTLALKPNADCMKLAPDQQYTCLTQSGNQSLLDDGHGQSLVAALSNGPGSDFINQASYTQLAGAGTYSAYVGAVVDLVRIMGSLHTAQYQYIPAIAFPQQQALNLRLNVPPSFHNPKSVIVIGLPAIQATAPPPLRPTDPKAVSCLAKPGLALQVEGAPLVFSTGFAHDLVLHLNYPAGTTPDASHPQDIPLTPDAYKGGLVLATIPARKPLPIARVTLPTLHPSAPNAPGQGTPASDASSEAEKSPAGLTGTIRGAWGFDTFTGPTMPLQTLPGKDWKIVSTDPLIAGKDQHVTLSSTGTACIATIALDPTNPKTRKEAWKPGDKPETVDVALNLSDLPGHDPGTLHLTVRQFGEKQTDTINLVSYAEPARLSALEYHTGDTSATLTGSSLTEVSKVEFNGVTLTPQGPADPSSLHLAMPSNASPPSPPAGDKLTAQVTLKDGRVLPVSFTVAASRPAVSLIGTADVPPVQKTPGLAIKLASTSDLPVADTLMFSLKSPQPFPRTGQIEVANSDGSLHTTLTVSGESLVLEDPRTILARFDPLKTFGPSAFGPLRLRAVAPDGATGDWLPLVTLVRLPVLSGLSCPVAPSAIAPAAAGSSSDAPPPAPAAAKANPAPSNPGPSNPAPSNPAPSNPVSSNPVSSADCTLSGSNLFLIDSISSDEAFTNPSRVPSGFVGQSVRVPPPTGDTYYLRLRDDPSAVNTVTLPAGPL